MQAIETSHLDVIHGGGCREQEFKFSVGELIHVEFVITVYVGCSF